jgi:hypothetical protein
MKKLRWVLWLTSPICFPTIKELHNYCIEKNITVYGFGKMK